MIKLENINKYYSSASGKYHALKDINLTLPDKGMIYIVGKSGSGKSTLLNVIGGIDSYDSGQLIIENAYKDENGEVQIEKFDTKNFKLSNYNAYRNSYIGFIFQEFNVIKTLTVYENVELSLSLQQKKEDKDLIYSILAKVGLKGKEQRKINELSGGERQRVAIARALIKDPKIIIADEPTGNLDAKNRNIVMDILKELSKEKLVLIVTHDKHLAGLYGDREITIRDGEIIKDVVLHQENIVDTLPTNYKMESLQPKAKVSWKLALKSFKLNRFRYIFIIILFAISLIFAGSVVNLVLADTTKEYANFQKEYGNSVVNLSYKYNYHDTINTTGFFTYDLAKAKKNFKVDNQQMTTFTSMHVNYPINKNSSLGNNDFWKESIDYVTIYENETQLTSNFIVEKDIMIQTNTGCYITDYLAYSLLSNNYYTDMHSYSNYKDVTGRKITVPGSNTPLTITGVIQTNFGLYLSKYNDGKLLNDPKYFASFNDNLTLYNSVFVTDTVYKKIYSSNNLYFYMDDILYLNGKKTEMHENVKFTYYNGDPLLAGNFPKRPKDGEMTLVAVSRGFINKVLGVKDINNLNFPGGKLSLGGKVPNSFYICGVERIPASMEFNISGIINTDEIIVYAPALDESPLYRNWINSSYVDGGFLTAIISQKANINSKIYRNLLDNDITINNPSFIKLQLVDNFISKNLYLFAALFFSFCLFSILMIFNFVLINIKNSTRDIGIYMSLGMNGFKISLIYLFQVLIISAISMVIGLIGSTAFIIIIDNGFASQAIVNFSILKVTFLGVLAVVALAFVTPIIAILQPLLSLCRKKPIDVIKVS